MRTAKVQISLQMRSLISTFFVRYLDSIIPLVSISKISSFYLASVAVQAGLSLIWLQTPKTGFLVTRLNYPKQCFTLLMSHDKQEHVFGDFQQVRFKPACSATEAR